MRFAVAMLFATLELSEACNRKCFSSALSRAVCMSIVHKIWCKHCFLYAHQMHIKISRAYGSCAGVGVCVHQKTFFSPTWYRNVLLAKHRDWQSQNVDTEQQHWSDTFSHFISSKYRAVAVFAVLFSRQARPTISQTSSPNLPTLLFSSHAIISVVCTATLHISKALYAIRTQNILESISQNMYTWL